MTKSAFIQKKVSILGDSISTLAGYQPAGYQVFFEGNNCARAGVWEMEQTWWGQVIQALGAELLANNSWSGSRVTRLPQLETLFPSGCSDERTFGLHVSDVFPDVIIIYLGMNDWANAVQPEFKQSADIFEASSAFLNAYEMMLTKLRINYPNAMIYCCTLNETTMSQNPNFKFPFSFGGIHLDVYNDKIREAAEKHGCSLIDFAKYHMPYDSIDGSHPNFDGMKTLATMALKEMLDIQMK